ncbi:MAG: alpha/beta hydrolase [Candidatus Dormibacteria bacterium]|jgi:pimeloyl-ACP methyl ester carboxylesterase
MSTTRTTTVTTRAAGRVEVTTTDQGEGHPFLLLHGGAGPQSVGRFAEVLTTTEPARALTPTHPGFGGTPRPERLGSVKALAEVYAILLDELDLVDVTVVGNSIGGWIAAELALLHTSRVNSLVLVDAGGLALVDHPAADFFSLTLDQVTNLSYFNPDAFRIDLSKVPDAQKAVIAGNRAALQAYGGSTMDDPTLLQRLPAIATPTLVVWGEADRIIPPEHGDAYARAIPGAQLQLIPDAGHLPQLETPQRLVQLVWAFAGLRRPEAA